MKPIRLEVGKRYVSRDGRITRPLVASCAPSYPFIGSFECDALSCMRTWRADGQWSYAATEQPADLVAEYMEPAIAPEPDAASRAILAIQNGDRIRAYQPIIDWLVAGRSPELFLSQMAECILFALHDLAVAGNKNAELRSQRLTDYALQFERLRREQADQP